MSAVVNNMIKTLKIEFSVKNDPQIEWSHFQFSETLGGRVKRWFVMFRRLFAKQRPSQIHENDLRITKYYISTCFSKS